MNRLRLAALTILTGISILSQAQPAVDNPLIRHIPVDANKVYHINYSVLSGKVDWQTLGPVIFKKEEDRKFITNFTDPTQMGVDPRFGIFIAQSNILSLDSPRYTTLVFALTDSAKFIKMLKDSHRPADGKLTIHTGKPRTGIQGKTVFAWNDKLIAITFIKLPLTKLIQQKDTGAHPNPDAPILQYIQPATRRTIAALRGFDNSIFVADPDFRAAIADDADAHTYTRFGSGFGMMSDLMKMAHAPVGSDVMATMEQLKRSHMHTLGTIRFDNGRMSMRSRLFYDSIAGLDVGLLPINTNLIERLPEGNLLGLLALHIDPMASANLIQRFGGAKTMKAIDSALAKKGLTVKDIFSAFKGDLLVAAIDNGQLIPATDSTPAKPGKPGFYIVVTIADKAAFDKLNDQLHLIRDSASTAPAGDSVKPKKPLAHTLRDNILVLGPDKQATEDFFNKPGRGPSRLVSEEVRTASFAFAIDVKALAQYLAPVMADGSPKSQQMKMLFDLFDQITFTVSKTRGAEAESLFDIKMTNSQQNSLTTISKLISSIAGK